VLNAGQEKPLNETDLGLEQHWSSTAVMGHTITMTSLALEYLSENDKEITFFHVTPGLVNTEILNKLIKLGMVGGFAHT